MAAPVLEASDITIVLNADADTNATGNKPTGTVEGDLLVAFVGSDDTAAVHGNPGGWTQVGSSIEQSSSEHSLWFKAAGASEPSTYTWSLGGASEAYYVGILRISGADNADPIDISSASGTSGDPCVCPDVTTTVDDTLILRACGTNDQGGNDVILDGGTPTSHTLEYSKPGAASGDVGNHVSFVAQASAGATGTANIDLSGATNHVRYTVAIAPAAAVAVPLVTLLPQRIVRHRGHYR